MVLRAPWRATRLVIRTLEKVRSQGSLQISATAKEAPDRLFRHHAGKVDQSEDQPFNVASGLYRGVRSMLKEIFGALTGVIIEPIKGGKRSGFKGAMVGIGKGMVGLVVRPVAGTLDLVTLTARGIANTPKTIYLNLDSIFKKGRKHQGPGPVPTPSGHTALKYLPN